MASAKHLPVFKEGNRLVLSLYQTTKKAPRELRYTLVQKLLSEAVELIVSIDTANRQQEPGKRLAEIRDVQKSHVRIGVLLTAAYEQRCLSKGAMTACLLHMEALGKQIVGWAKYTESSLAASMQSDSAVST